MSRRNLIAALETLEREARGVVPAPSHVELIPWASPLEYWPKGGCAHSVVQVNNERLGRVLGASSARVPLDGYQWRLLEDVKARTVQERRAAPHGD